MRSPAVERLQSVRDRSRRQPRVLLPAFLASAAIHAAVLVLPFHPAGQGVPVPANPRVAGTELARSMRVYNLVPVERPVVTARQRTAVELSRPTVEVRVIDTGETVGQESQPAPDPSPDGEVLRKAADVFRVRTGDPSLWTPIMRSSSPGNAPFTGEGPGLAEGIRRYYDSIASAEEAQRKLTTWTRRGDTGSAWGFSSGRLHLGSWTLPYCGGENDGTGCGFGTPSGLRDVYRARLRTDREIRLQRRAIDLRRTLQERAKRTRELRRAGGGSGLTIRK